MLIIFGGLPGAGKSTIAREVACTAPAVFVRIEIIEQAMRSSGRYDGIEMGPEGYIVGHCIAESNLRLGHMVVADSVNPWPITREGWRSVAVAASCPSLEVEVVCSDLDEHRRRVESRASHIPGLVLPDWEAVVARDYRSWPEADLRIDTAQTPPEEAVETILRAVKAKKTSPKHPESAA